MGGVQITGGSITETEIFFMNLFALGIPASERLAIG